ncbi:MAG: DUF5665 domain-containing protein [Patescibacteria group bacterium]|nr:DUF5665 domain-containing protein [Actinomycetota bacterium]MCL5970095.1 DUF5665 domain-containing protein [Patescibacteria group bacterium]
MEKHEQIHKTKKEIFFNNFLGGVAWGLGATVGVSVFFTGLAFLLSKINLIPVVGNFVTGVIGYILQNNPNLLVK